MSDDRPVLERGRMYKLDEVAAILGVSISTVRRWVRGGMLPAKRIGRLWFVYGGDLLPSNSDSQDVVPTTYGAPSVVRGRGLEAADQWPSYDETRRETGPEAD